MKDIIDKAVKGGFKWGDFLLLQKNIPLVTIDEAVSMMESHGFVEPLIFSHDFLKAFFGEEMYDHECLGNEDSYCSLPSWQYHAQQLVLSTDRKKYLKRFI